ncbi:hypothetical protein [Stenotrophomonas koreensis]|nr:hypothetical protein [Stenotrophomonas koreensis]
MSLMPRPTAPMVGPGGVPTREWLDYLRGLAGSGDMAGIVKAIEKLQQQVAEIERTPAVAGDVQGIGAIRSLGLLSDGLVRLDLRELEDAGGGELLKILRDGYGRVTGTSSAEAPQDGKQYARKDGGWAEVQSGGGGVLPMVNGETPPLLMYGGNQLIYARVE